MNKNKLHYFSGIVFEGGMPKTKSVCGVTGVECTYKLPKVRCRRCKYLLSLRTK